ncbi:MAG: hypothetical protein QM820_53785 [Minicystis sp.]
MRTLICLPVALLVAAAPGVALATPTFPSSIQTDLSLSYTPPCTICHDTTAGGTGTVHRAFGTAMQGRGLVSGDTDSLKNALTALEAEKTDSDCDGTGDVQQLRDGRDPNTGEYIDGSGKPTPEVDGGCAGSDAGTDDNVPHYGCGAQLAADPLPETSLPIAATMATVIGLALSRRRRRA